ncbi:MAG: methylated-DNA--[protein]-cysteine S-methyltransferase [Planctomycetota bacterium]|nr:methylated-DNA--[protein]-cysteine S-methyltransferase [Planctomycetota bacterium]
MSPKFVCQQIIDSPVGALVASWSAQGLYSFEFLRSPPPHEEPTQATEHAGELEDCICAYFESGQLQWDLKCLDWTGISDFHRRTLETCFAIPCGQTQTYGQMATNLGSPGAARAVGGAMAKNRWPVLIPCHRVVGSSGKLTGYSGVGGIETKRKLLELEQAWAGKLLFS